MVEFENTDLPGVVLLKPKVFTDPRGRFQELYNQKKYDDSLPDSPRFVQDNFSVSSLNVLRGLHFQKQKPQGKLVTVLFGAVLDVVADINPQSPTYGKYFSTVLSDENNHQLYLAPGYAHGFCVLTEKVYFHYKCTEFYNPQDEHGIIWNCKTLNIKWPISAPLLSEKDSSYGDLINYNGR